MTKAPRSDDGYPPQQAQARFEAALRGARSAGHKAMSEISPSKATKRAKRRPASKKKPGR